MSSMPAAEGDTGGEVAPDEYASAAEGLQSHVLFPGSDFWASVPRPVVPTVGDASGLGLPAPHDVPGYVQWSMGVSGPKTKQQVYVDSIIALMRSVHALPDAKSPSQKEIDALLAQRRKRREGRPGRAAVTIRLASVLITIRRVFVAFATVHVGRRLQAQEFSSLIPVAAGVVGGLLIRRACHKRTQARAHRKRSLAQVSPKRWERLFNDFMNHPSRRMSQGPYWTHLLLSPEPAAWLNRALKRFWQIYEYPVVEAVRNAVDPILNNVKPAVFSQLKIHSIKFGMRAPEVLAVESFRTTAHGHVLHARVRLVADDMHATIFGKLIPAGRIIAGVKSLKIDTWVRIELCRAMPLTSRPPLQPPWFTAINISFLQPLSPYFRLSVKSMLMPGSYAESAVKPMLSSILRNNVFSKLFVWPERLVVGIGGGPRVQRDLPLLQPKIKGLLAIQVQRAVQLSRPTPKGLVAFSVDGITWYRSGQPHAKKGSGSGYEANWPTPDEGDPAGRADLVIVPLGEPDLMLRVCLAERDHEEAAAFRESSHGIVLARAEVNLHDLHEGEVLEGWLRMSGAESTGLLDPVDIEPTVEQGVRTVFERQSISGRPRFVFDTYQRLIAPLVGEHESSPSLQSQNSASLQLSTPPVDVMRQRMSKSEAVASLLEPRDASGDGEGSAGDRADSAGASQLSGQTGSRSLSSVATLASAAPKGALRVRLCVLRESSLKATFGVASALQRGRGRPGPPEGSRARAGGMERADLLQRAFGPWAAKKDDVQLGCLFVHVHRAAGLNRWNVQGRHFHSFKDVPRFDACCTVSLVAPGASEPDPGSEKASRIVEDCRDPEFNSKFEYLGVLADRKLVFWVSSERDVSDMQMYKHRIGTVELPIADLANYKHKGHNMGKAPRVSLDLHCHKDGATHIVTGALDVSLEWIPVNGGSIPLPSWSALPPPAADPWLERHASAMKIGGRRGALYVRVVRAWDLPAVQLSTATCMAKVQVITSGTEFNTERREGLFPVWLEKATFESVREDTDVIVNVFHSETERPELVGTFTFSMLDVSHIPNEALLIIKQLYAHTHGHDPGDLLPHDDDSDDHASSGSNTFRLHTAGSGAQVPKYNHGLGTTSIIPASGSIGCERVTPPNMQSSGCVALEVAFRYDDITGLRSQFQWPSIDEPGIVADAEALQRDADAVLHRVTAAAAPKRKNFVLSQREEALVASKGHVLRVEVLYAAAVPTADLDGYSDPYVILTAQSEAGLQMFRTATVRTSKEPQWNESFDVWNAHSDGGSVEIQLWDDDRARKDDLLAKLTVQPAKALLRVLKAPGDGENDTAADDAEGGEGDGEDEAGRQTAAQLPLDKVVVVEQTLKLGLAGAGLRKRRHVPPMLQVRWTWVPERGEKPWGDARAGKPMLPWRDTSLKPRAAVVGVDGGGLVGAVSAQEVARGRLQITIKSVPEGGQLSRYPMYVTARRNLEHIGKTSKRFDCQFERQLEPLDNVDVDDILVFKLKGQNINKFLLGQAQVRVQDLVRSPEVVREDVPQQLPLHGCGAVLNVTFTWLPVSGYQ